MSNILPAVGNAITFVDIYNTLNDRGASHGTTHNGSDPISLGSFFSQAVAGDADFGPLNANEDRKFNKLGINIRILENGGSKNGQAPHVLGIHGDVPGAINRYEFQWQPSDGSSGFNSYQFKSANQNESSSWSYMLLENPNKDNIKISWKRSSESGGSTVYDNLWIWRSDTTKNEDDILTNTTSTTGWLLLLGDEYTSQRDPNLWVNDTAQQDNNGVTGAFNSKYVAIYYIKDSSTNRGDDSAWFSILDESNQKITLSDGPGAKRPLLTNSDFQSPQAAPGDRLYVWYKGNLITSFVTSSSSLVNNSNDYGYSGNGPRIGPWGTGIVKYYAGTLSSLTSINEWNYSLWVGAGSQYIHDTRSQASGGETFDGVGNFSWVDWTAKGIQLSRDAVANTGGTSSTTADSGLIPKVFQTTQITRASPSIDNTLITVSSFMRFTDANENGNLVAGSGGSSTSDIVNGVKFDAGAGNTWKLFFTDFGFSSTSGQVNMLGQMSLEQSTDNSSYTPVNNINWFINTKNQYNLNLAYGASASNWGQTAASGYQPNTLPNNITNAKIFYGAGNPPTANINARYLKIKYNNDISNLNHGNTGGSGWDISMNVVDSNGNTTTNPQTISIKDDFAGRIKTYDTAIQVTDIVGGTSAITTDDTSTAAAVKFNLLTNNDSAVINSNGSFTTSDVEAPNCTVASLQTAGGNAFRVSITPTGTVPREVDVYIKHNKFYAGGQIWNRKSNNSLRLNLNFPKITITSTGAVNGGTANAETIKFRFSCQHNFDGLVDTSQFEITNGAIASMILFQSNYIEFDIRASSQGVLVRIVVPANLISAGGGKTNPNSSQFTYTSFAAPSESPICYNFQPIGSVLESPQGGDFRAVEGILDFETYGKTDVGGAKPFPVEGTAHGQLYIGLKTWNNQTGTVWQNDIAIGAIQIFDERGEPLKNLIGTDGKEMYSNNIAFQARGGSTSGSVTAQSSKDYIDARWRSQENETTPVQTANTMTQTIAQVRSNNFNSGGLSLYTNQNEFSFKGCSIRSDTRSGSTGANDGIAPSHDENTFGSTDFLAQDSGEYFIFRETSGSGKWTAACFRSQKNIIIKNGYKIKIFYHIYSGSYSVQAPEAVIFVGFLHELATAIDEGGKEIPREGLR